MIEGIARYPLTWPIGQPRTARRKESAFKVDFARARDEVLHSLELLGARAVMLSTNVPLRRDGLPYANMPEPNDPGVAVYFERRLREQWRPFVLACDTYTKVRWNLRAVGVTIEAFRSMQRHGATSLLEQAFAGFAALPPAGVVKPWWDVLGVARGASEKEIEAAYVELALIHHPDRGGDTARMAEINKARTEAFAQ